MLIGKKLKQRLQIILFTKVKLQIAKQEKDLFLDQIETKQQ